MRRRGPASASLLFLASGTPACRWGARVVALQGEHPPPSFGLGLQPRSLARSRPRGRRNLSGGAAPPRSALFVFLARLT